MSAPAQRQASFGSSVAGGSTPASAAAAAPGAVPSWAACPPIESVVFAWGASEDHQLGLDTEGDTPAPKVVEALLGLRFMG